MTAGPEQPAIGAFPARLPVARRGTAAVPRARSRSRPDRPRLRPSAAGRAACGPVPAVRRGAIARGSSQATVARSSSGAVSGARATSSSPSFCGHRSAPEAGQHAVDHRATPAAISASGRVASTMRTRCGSRAAIARYARRTRSKNAASSDSMRSCPAPRPASRACATSAGASKTSVRSGVRPRMRDLRERADRARRSRRGRRPGRPRSCP